MMNSVPIDSAMLECRFTETEKQLMREDDAPSTDVFLKTHTLGSFNHSRETWAFFVLLELGTGASISLSLPLPPNPFREESLSLKLVQGECKRHPN